MLNHDLSKQLKLIGNNEIYKSYNPINAKIAMVSVDFAFLLDHDQGNWGRVNLKSCLVIKYKN